MDEKLDFFEKADVNGDNAREVYKYLTKELPNEDGTVDIAWNFGEFFFPLSVFLVGASACSFFSGLTATTPFYYSAL